MKCPDGGCWLNEQGQHQVAPRRRKAAPNFWLANPNPAGSYKYAKANYDQFKADGMNIVLRHSGSWWYIDSPSRRGR